MSHQIPPDLSGADAGPFYRLGIFRFNRELIAREEAVDSPQRVVLDMDSTEIPVYGQQENSALSPDVAVQQCGFRSTADARLAMSRQHYMINRLHYGCNQRSQDLRCGEKLQRCSIE